ncbi:Serine/threonine-protein kinase [Microsporum canis]|uniref:non-specific serine/threonine protein kinase n=1 Tax=Arthroderma otae (strain ATCC MYA-4605 / CBS 113480) TaxID=554155 RepID=C5FXJ7_ARTOC|nr:Vps15p [Microsporum canis CBS 113480]EEQ35037.1 Vps15p [Microsporum canis CBS 113480]
MGQGYSLTSLSAGSAGIDVPELADLTYERSLGTARFMKSIRARHRDGLAFVKVIMKPYPSLKLDPYVKAIMRERRLLEGVPNALGYQRILETSTAGYLVRQYIYSSLYDRMSTRPFLEDIEKKWMAFQLLCALRDCHAQNVFHGDIKTENVLVTSWNWLYLSDFSSSFKPTFLPEDNPADFSFYFDTSGRRTCYLAPERFLEAGEDPGSRSVNWAMDVFSAGCVIAELFLESPIFTLSQLYKYRKGEYSPQTGRLMEIEDLDIRELIIHMIQLNPESRYSAEECINFWRRKAFPEYFYGFLHQYMGLITEPSPGRTRDESTPLDLKEADERISRIFVDFDKISYFLGASPQILFDGSQVASPSLTQQPFPLQLDLPKVGNQQISKPLSATDDGTLIFLTLVVSSLRNTSKSSARIKACDILLAFAEKLPDEAKLDRILPFIILLLNDRADNVKVSAIRTLTQLLAMVKVVSPVNAYVVPEYIFPRLQHLINTLPSNPTPMVRAAYASSIASLAHSSLRILDMVQALRSDARLTSLVPSGSERGWEEEISYHNLYDVARVDLLEFFEAHAKALLTDPDVVVRRAFLGSVPGLCVFFGNPKANEVVLSHLNTYLNDKDWILKCAFFETVVGVAAYVGSTSLEEFILPLIVQSMTDPEEFVVERVLRSLAKMSRLGLFQRSTTWDLLSIAVRFFVHPSIWIREAAVSFVVDATTFLSATDKYCIVSPLVRPFLKTNTTDISTAQIFDALKKPLPKNVFDMLLVWATNVDKGLFWKAVAQDGTFSLGGSNIPKLRHRGVGSSLSNMPRNEEDDQWLSRLRNIGLTQENEAKFLALREYIWRVAMRRKKDADDDKITPFAEIISLSEHDITPQTVLFDRKQGVSRSRPAPRKTQLGHGVRKPHTIADALLDASTAIDSHNDDHQRRTRRPVPEERGSSVPPSLIRPAEIRDRREEESPTISHVSSSPNGQPGSLSSSTSPLSDSPAQNPVELNTMRNDGNGPVRAGTPSLRVAGGDVKRRSSAINLLNRQENSKANAATATSSTNAFGKVDVPHQRDLSQLSRATTPDPQNSGGQTPRPRYKASHTYQGNDPTILRILDNIFAENYPTDLFDFGPIVHPPAQCTPLHGPNGQIPDKPWRPQGGLVAMFGEHTGPVNRVVTAPDHAFFITASDDGTLKIWDTARLERNLTPRSRQTHRHAPGAKVKCVTFVENTYTFISAATDGSVHAVRVDYQNHRDVIRYGKSQLVREYHITPTDGGSGEYAVWIEHFRTDVHSILLMATNRSRIIALDLKSMTEVYTLQNPIRHGTITTFCLDRKHNWLLVGTTHGILDLWDLRFCVRVKAWGLPGGTPIRRLAIHPTKGRGRWVCVVGGGNNGSEVLVWDIDRVQCREVYRTISASTSQTTPAAGQKANLNADISCKAYEPWKVDEDLPEGMLGRFATNAHPSSASIEPTVAGENSAGGDRNAIFALAVGIDYLDGTAEGSKCGFFVTAGLDRSVRFWDVVHPDASLVVSSPDLVSDGTQMRPRYDTTHPTTSLTITSEWIPSAGSSPTRQGAASNKKSNSTNTGSGMRPPRSTVISLQQQLLLRSHLDSILDIAILESPYAMTVSVDRAGMIYVFQ